MNNILNYISKVPDSHWFDYKRFYYQIANSLPNKANIVEIGNHYGCSSLYLADILNKRKIDYNLFLVDNSNGDNRKSLKDFVSKEGLSSITFVDSDSLEAYKLFEDNSLDFLFIDGNHEYSHVRKDIYLWQSKVKSDGIMAGHDYYLTTDVKFAVEQQIPGYLLDVLSTDNNYGVWKKNNNIYKHVQIIRDFVKKPEDFFIYIPYVNRIDLLKLAIKSQEKYVNSIVVINQSGVDISSEIKDVAIYDMDIRHFSCMQNFAQELAKSIKVKHFIFQHNDCVVHKDVIADLIKVGSENPETGVVFTNYDALCLFNTEIINKVGCWDESFEWYVADIDYYQRIKMDGYKHINIGTEGVEHATSQTLAALQPEIVKQVGINHSWAWKHYIHKWGGNQHNEIYKMPYNGRP